jgi:hypothetical protein
VAGEEDESGESRKERVDRELIELLNELRVSLPGVQVLFAFLLILPFQNGWQKVTELQQDVYFAAFICATIAGICLISPSANHRIQFRQGTDVKEHLLLRSNKVAIVGSAFLAAGMTLAVFLITDVLFAATSAALVSAGIALALLVLWYLVPIWARFKYGRPT